MAPMRQWIYADALRTEVTTALARLSRLSEHPCPPLITAFETCLSVVPAAFTSTRTVDRARAWIRQQRRKDLESERPSTRFDDQS